MSAERSPSNRAHTTGDLHRRPDMAHLRARRREARRRQRVARIDLGLGFAAALVLLLATPGLAITLLLVLAILAICGISIVRERRIHSRAATAERPAATVEPPVITDEHQAISASRAPRRSSEHVVRERPRSTR
jgi:hypothetical protein